MSRKPFLHWNPLWILLAYLVASNAVASTEDLLEMYVQTDATGLEFLKWCRRIMRLAIFVVFLYILDLGFKLILIIVLIIFSYYYNIYHYNSNH